MEAAYTNAHVICWRFVCEHAHLPHPSPFTCPAHLCLPPQLRATEVPRAQAHTQTLHRLTRFEKLNSGQKFKINKCFTESTRIALKCSFKLRNEICLYVHFEIR